MTFQDWHRADVKAALEKKGLTLAAVARTNGYHESSVRKALRRPWPAVERIIAAALGRHPKEIWPSRYDPAGRHLRVKRRANASTLRRGAPNQNRAAG